MVRIVAGPEVKLMLWNVWRLDSAMAEEVEKLLWISVGKSGPKYWIRFL